jgi:hypothetical protein
MLGDGVLLQELLALAVAEAEEHYVHLVERHGVGKAQVGIAQQTLVHIGYEIASITLTIGKDYFGRGMMHQQTDELATRITSSTQYSYLNHRLMLNWFFSSGMSNMSMKYTMAPEKAVNMVSSV